MVDSLNATPGGLPLSDEAAAEAQGKTTFRFYRLALRLAAGDEDAAREMLRGPLEAIGLLPYQSGTGKYHWGQAT